MLDRVNIKHTTNKFLFRLYETTKVCESNLELTFNWPVYQITLTKKVPCFAPQTVLVANTTASDEEEIPTTNDLEAMFSEVEGVLVWGGVDRFKNTLSFTFDFVYNSGFG